MTTIAFAPNNSQTPPWQSTATLDGQTYSLTAMWNFAAQRWYLTITSQSGAAVWHGPIVSSSASYSIALAASVFTRSTIIYSDDATAFIITP